MSYPLSDNTGRFERDLDRHITGNFGEDFFGDDEDDWFDRPDEVEEDEPSEKDEDDINDSPLGQEWWKENPGG